MSTLTTSIEGYLHSLEHDRRVTPATLKNYRSTLARYALQHTALDEDGVRAFLRSYKNPSSANVVYTRLRGLAEYLDVDLKIPRAIEPVKDPEALSSRDIDRLLQACYADCEELGESTAILADTGLRWHEFEALNSRSALERDGVRYLNVNGKGRKGRRVPLSERAFHALQGLAWPRKLHEKEFRRRLAAAGVKAGLPMHIHPHLLRASCASIMKNERGVDSAVIMKIMGWARIDTFAKHYFKESLGLLSRAVN